ncbi:unnamed protein product, partial [Polarella glacialis]
PGHLGQPEAVPLVLGLTGSISEGGGGKGGGGKFGFIDQDDGGEKMFVMPAACRSFGSMAIPAVGTRVSYDVVLDPKSGRPRAENVQPLGPLPAQMERAFATLSPHQGLPGPGHSGTVSKSGTSFGFIEQDSGGESMFVLPLSCGGQIPPVGTRVTYE